MIVNNNGIKVRDVVCGMLIDLGNEPKRTDYDGEILFFCSNSCKERFLLEPAKYVSKRPAV